MLHQQLKEEVKNALKEKNEVKLLTIRGLLAAFTNELVANRRKPDEILEDEAALAVIKREVKKRKDSIVQFKAGGREDLAEKEKAELAFLESYLPPTLPREAIKKVVEAKMRELEVTEKADAGKLIGAVMKELKGAADGGDVKAVVDDLLQ